ncbi:MAG: hypothetical protein WA383_16225 [Terriglobales bacterium]
MEIISGAILIICSISGSGYRVFVCDNMAFHGDFTPVLSEGELERFIRCHSTK